MNIDAMARRAQYEWQRAEEAEAEVAMLTAELERLGAYDPIRIPAPEKPMPGSGQHPPQG